MSFERDERETLGRHLDHAYATVPGTQHGDLVLVPDTEDFVNAFRFLEVRQCGRRQLGEVQLHQADHDVASDGTVGQFDFIAPMDECAAAFTGRLRIDARFEVLLVATRAPGYIPLLDLTFAARSRALAPRHCQQAQRCGDEQEREDDRDRILSVSISVVHDATPFWTRRLP